MQCTADGDVAEYDKPHVLLENQSGYLSAMVDALGPATSNQLRKNCRSGATALNIVGQNVSLLPFGGSHGAQP